MEPSAFHVLVLPACRAVCLGMTGGIAIHYVMRLLEALVGPFKAEIQPSFAEWTRSDSAHPVVRPVRRRGA